MSTSSDAGADLANLRSGAKGTMATTIITCPPKPNQAEKVFGDTFTADELEYMRLALGLRVDCRRKADTSRAVFNTISTSNRGY